jgi:outer membrane protein TolC
MKNKFFTLILTVGCCCTFAQQSLSLEQCIALARTRNLQLKNAHSALDAGIYSQHEQAAARHPQLKATGALLYAPHTGAWGYDPAVTDGGQVNAQISVQQPLNSRANRLQAQLSELDQRLLESQYTKTERELIISVQQQFLETLRNETEYQLRTETLNRLSEYLDIVRLHHAGGTGGYSDILKTKVQLSNTQEAQFKALTLVRLSKTVLASLIGMPSDTSFQLTGSIDTMVSVVHDALYNLDTLNNPDILASRNELRKGTLELELLNSGKYPAIAFSLDGGYLSSIDRLISGESKTNFGISAGINIEFPIVDWGIRHNRQLRQQLAIDTLQNSAQIQMQLLLTEHRSLQIQITNMLSLLGLVNKRTSDAEEDLLLTKSKYAAGASSSADLLLAQQAFADALLDLLQTKADIVTLANKLEQLSDQQRSNSRDK